MLNNNNNNKLLLYKKIFNLKNKQNKLFVYLLSVDSSLIKNKFEIINIKLNFDQYISRMILQKKVDQMCSLFFLLKQFNKYLQYKIYINNNNNNFILNIQKNFYFEIFKKNEKNILNKYEFIYIQNIFLLIFFNNIINEINIIKYYNINIQKKINLFKIELYIADSLDVNIDDSTEENFIENSIEKYNLENEIIKKNLINNNLIKKYNLFIKAILIKQTNIIFTLNYFYLNIFTIDFFNKNNEQFALENYYNYLVKNIFNFEELIYLSVFNISKNFFQFFDILNNDFFENYYIYNNLIFETNLLFYIIINKNNNQLKKKIIYYKNEYISNIENLNEHLTVNLLENIQQNKNTLNYNFQNFSIGEQNPQNMSLDKYLKFLKRKTTLSLIDRRGLIHRYFDLNVKKFYETNFKIVKFGYLINIDSIKLWLINFQQLLYNFIKGKLQGLELLILCGFGYKKKTKLRKLLITYLILRQNTQSLIYNHNIVSRQDSLIFLNNFEKDVIEKKNEIINKSIEDISFLDQIFFLSVMSVKFIIENFIENELKYDSRILEKNRRNWYRNELYKLYRTSIFNLSKEIFKNSFNYFIDFCYYKNLNELSLNIVSFKFKNLLKFVLPSMDIINTNNIFFKNDIEFIIKNFRMNQKLFCNKFRFRYLRSYQHIFLKNKYKRNLALNVLIENLINKNENIYFFFNLIKQLNLTLISHIYLCQLVFFRIIRILQEIRLLHFESFYLNKMNLDLKLRNQVPDVYIFILNVLFFIDNKLSFYNEFWEINFINNETGIICYNFIGVKKYVLNLYSSNILKENKFFSWIKRIKQLSSFCKNNIKKKPSKYYKRIKFIKQKTLVYLEYLKNKAIDSEINYKNFIKIKEIKKDISLNFIEFENLCNLFLINQNIDIKSNKLFSTNILKFFFNYIRKYRYFLFMNEICNIILKSDKFYLNNINYINKSFFKNYLKLSNYSYAIFGKSKFKSKFKLRSKFKLNFKSRSKFRFVS